MIDELRDVNGDQRPDLVGRVVFEGGVGCETGSTQVERTPEFAAISRADGTFDARGSEAQAFARRSCGERPRSSQQIDSVQDVLCARLWGATQAEIRASIERRFAPSSCDDATDRRRSRGRRARRDFELLRAAAVVALPLTLAPEPHVC